MNRSFTAVLLVVVTGMSWLLSRPARTVNATEAPLEDKRGRRQLSVESGLAIWIDSDDPLLNLEEPLVLGEPVVA